MRSRFRVATFGVALMATLVVATPVAATSPWVVFKQSGTSAFVFSGDCTENPDATETCEGQSLDVFKGTIKQSGEPTRKGEQACYSEFTYTFNPATGEASDSHGLFGCTFDADTLTVDDLTSITLAPTVIELTAIDCDATSCTESPDGSTTVFGTWTGVGPIVSQKGKFKFDDGSCVQVNADSGHFRQATFEGSIDAIDAAMGEGSFTFKTNCTF
jgi:hypothetical protein